MNEVNTKIRDDAPPSIYLTALVEHVGNQRRVSEMIGCSASYVSEAVRVGRVSQCYELAAQLKYQQLVENSFAGASPEAIMRHLRDDLDAARKQGLSDFRFDENGTLRASVRQEL